MHHLIEAAQAKFVSILPLNFKGTASCARLVVAERMRTGQDGIGQVSAFGWISVASGMAGKNWAPAGRRYRRTFLQLIIRDITAYSAGYIEHEGDPCERFLIREALPSSGT
jgi:hypothetical protein